MKAAIDIGTNTVLLLVAEVRESVITPIHEEHRVPRLGKGVDADRTIGVAATKRVSDVLNEYQKIIQSQFPEVESIIVTATSAVRDANNREEFIRDIKNETGLEIRLLLGKEEAEWTADGALSVLSISGKSNNLILDIGGGSTEVAYLSSSRVSDAYSYDMGSVRFTERFLKTNPPMDKEINACKNVIREYYESRPFSINGNVEAIGVAGTLTSLAGMALDLNEYKPQNINGFKVTRTLVQKVISDFSNHSSEAMLKKYPVYLAGRADIFMAGILILDGFLDAFDQESILVSTGGIRHGAILKTS